MTISPTSRSAAPEISQALESLHSLLELMDNSQVHSVLVRADGHWLCDHSGCLQARTPPLSADVSRALVQAVYRHGPGACHNGWWVRPVEGPLVGTVELRRRPRGDGLSEHTSTLLNTRLSAEASGLVFGQSRRARSAMLLNIPEAAGASFAIYVGAVPPLVPDDTNLLVVDPPQDDRQRMQLAPLLEDAALVLFDTPVVAADVRLLFSGRVNSGRWLAADVTSPRPTEAPWAEAIARIDTRIGVNSAGSDSVRLKHFSQRSSDGWELVLDDGRPPEGDALPQETTVDPAVRSYGPDDNATTNPETPSRLIEESSPESHHPPVGEESDADESTAVNLDTLDDDSSPSPLRESGEIEVPGFTSSSEVEVVDDDPPPEPASAEVLRGDRIDEQLPELVASSDVDDVKIPELDPRQLRRTYEGEVDSETLRQIREMRRRQRQNQSPDHTDSDDSSDRIGAETERIGAETEQLTHSGEPETDELDPPDGHEPDTTEVSVDDVETNPARQSVDDAASAPDSDYGAGDDDTANLSADELFDRLDAATGGDDPS